MRAGREYHTCLHHTMVIEKNCVTETGFPSWSRKQVTMRSGSQQYETHFQKDQFIRPKRSGLGEKNIRPRSTVRGAGEE